MIMKIGKIYDHLSIIKNRLTHYISLLSMKTRVSSIILKGVFRKNNGKRLF